MPFSILLLYCLAALVAGQSLNIDLANSMQFGNSSKGIISIAIDGVNNYIVTFNDSSTSIYDSTFRFVKSVSLMDIIDTLVTVDFAPASLNFANGSIWTFQQFRGAMTYSNNYTKVSFYNTTDFSLLGQFNPGQKIIQMRSYALCNSNISVIAVVLICTSTIKVGFNNSLQTIMSYTNIKAGMNLTASYPTGDSWSSSNGNLMVSQIYYYGMTDAYSYYNTIYLTFSYISASNSLGFSVANSSISQLMLLPKPIVKYLLVNIPDRLLLMQAGDYSDYIIKVSSSSLGTIDPSINNKFIQQFINLFGRQYIVFSGSLTQIIYTSSNYSLWSGISINLTANLHNIISSSQITFLWNQNSPQLYKVYPTACSTQAKYNTAGVCQNYTCSDSNCLSCKWQASVCNQCVSNYTLTSNYTCEIPVANTSATTNTSVNTTNSSSIYSQTDMSASESIKFLAQLLGIMTNTLSEMISIPAARSAISPLFYYFGNFDAIYLFMFHDRIYGDTLNSLLGNISQIQQDKWTIIDSSIFLQKINVNTTQLMSYLDYQSQYLTYAFSSANHPYLGSEGLYNNNINFFLINVPFTFIFYLILRAIFGLFSKYPFSRFLRSYSLWGTFFILCFQGNIQQFSFYLSIQLRKVFAFLFAQKMIKFSVILFGFIVIVLSLSSCLICYFFYRKINKYLTENYRNYLPGVIMLTMRYSLCGFFLGIMNSFLRLVHYNYQISLLLVIQIFFLLTVMLSSGMKVYRAKFKVWVFIFIDILRILLMVSLYFDYTCINNYISQCIERYLIFTMIGLFGFGIILGVFDLLAEFLQKTKWLLKKVAQTELTERINNKKVNNKNIYSTITKLQSPHDKNILILDTELIKRRILPRQMKKIGNKKVGTTIKNEFKIINHYLIVKYV